MTVAGAKRYRRKRMAEINVVPYIDVMLVLLLIFMVTAPLLAEGVRVSLPQASAKPIDNRQEEPVIVSVDQKGTYFINIGGKPDEAVEPDVLVARVAAVKRLNKNMEVLVRGDRDANYGDVVGAMVLLQKAGVDNVGLVTRTPKRKK